MAIPPDETRGPQILAISWTTLTLATVTIALRAHMRRKAHATGWDDYFMFLALVCLLSATSPGLDGLTSYGSQLITVFGSICTSMQVHYGFGRHIHNVPLKELSLLIEWTTIAIIVNYIGIFCVKISVSLFVLRVIKGTHRRIRLLLYCFMVILALSTLAGIVTTSTQCIPLKKSWTQELPGKCVSRSVFDLTFSVFGGEPIAREHCEDTG